MPSSTGGGIVKGPMSLELDYIQKRRYDKSRTAVTIERHDYPFTHTLLETQLKKLKCTDVEVISFIDDEMPFSLRVKAVAGDPNSIDVHNDDIGLIQVMSVIRNEFIDYQYDSVTDTATYTTATAASLNTDVFNPEQCIVTAIGGVVVAGYTRVSIRRQHVEDGAAIVNNIATALWDTVTSGHKVIRLFRTNFAGGDAGEAVSKNLDSVTNYLGKAEHEIEIDDWQMAVEQFGELAPWVRIKNQGTKDYMRQVNHLMMYSRGKKWTENGKLAARTYGLQDCVSPLSKRVIASKTISAFNAALDPLLDLGGRGDRFWFCGGYFLRSMNDIFEQKGIYNDPQTQKMLGFSVDTFKDYQGGLHHMILDRTMKESSLYDNRAFVVNFKYLRYAYLAGEDIRLWMGPNGKGIQSNSSPNIKAQLRGTIGLFSTVGRGSATEYSHQGMLVMPT